MVGLDVLKKMNGDEEVSIQLVRDVDKELYDPETVFKSVFEATVLEDIHPAFVSMIAQLKHMMILRQ